MNPSQFDDLKQFISTSISQSEERLKEEIKEVRQEIQDIRREMADGFLGVGEAIDEIHRQLDEQRSTTDTRLTKLEQQLAQ